MTTMKEVLELSHEARSILYNHKPDRPHIWDIHGPRNTERGSLLSQEVELAVQSFPDSDTAKSYLVDIAVEVWGSDPEGIGGYGTAMNFAIRCIQREVARVSEDQLAAVEAIYPWYVAMSQLTTNFNGATYC